MDRHGPLPHLLLVLTVGTGLLDAVSYLKFGHVFVANMTGNVVFLGFAVAGASDVSVSSSLLALVAFLAGALVGGRVGIRYGEHRGRLLASAIAIESVLVAAALLVAVQRGTALDEAARNAVVVLLAVAMGAQNATARTLGVPDLTTTVLTLTLTGLAADSRWAGGTSPRWSRRLAAVAAMLAGALVGGFLVLHVSLAAALGAATAPL
ncbi:MAG TPA: YoaK family protein, partial [bacterium]